MQPHEIEEAFEQAESEVDPRTIRFFLIAFIVLICTPALGLLIKAAHASNTQPDAEEVTHAPVIADN